MFGKSALIVILTQRAASPAGWRDDPSGNLSPMLTLGKSVVTHFDDWSTLISSCLTGTLALIWAPVVAGVTTMGTRQTVMLPFSAFMISSNLISNCVSVGTPVARLAGMSSLAFAAALVGDIGDHNAAATRDATATRQRVWNAGREVANMR